MTLSTGPYLDTTRRSGAGHLRENVHHRRARVGMRPVRQRGLRANLLYYVLIHRIKEENA